MLSICMAALLIVCLAACGNDTQTDPKETQAPAEGQKDTAQTTNAAVPESAPADNGSDTQPSTAAEPDDAGTASDDTGALPGTASDDTEVQPDAADDDTAARSDVLVAYFSATGTTKGVAEKIAAITGGDLYEIVPAQPYTEDDLNYNDRDSRSTTEQNDKGARPEISGEAPDLSGYATVYLGFPIWWGEEPRIMDTFVESCSFEGITVIPFCTSASSGIGRSGPNMEELAGSGTWLDGKRFSGGVTEADLRSWIEGLE